MIVDVSPALGTDYYAIEELLTDEEREIRDRVRAFCEKEVIPVIAGYWDQAEFPFALLPKLAELNIMGGTIEGYGCPGMSEVASGLVAAELARGDGSLNTFYGGHSALAMSAIAMLGNEDQKDKWLPLMARLEKIGAFGLTEARHGSDAVMLETSARRDGDEYVIEGEKRWIGNATFADVTLIWARDEEGNVGGFLVEKETPGFSTGVITGKTAKRAVWQADIKLEGARVPVENRLAHSNGFKDTAKVLTDTRYFVAWEAIGHAVVCYEAALTYAKERTSFDEPLASYQLVQNKLANMLAEITSMQLLCLRLSQLLAAGKMTPGMASLAKMNNAKNARQVCAEARDILGGNGILLDYHVARHHADIEVVYTYEGTDTIQSLIVGREITGVQAFTRAGLDEVASIEDRFLAPRAYRTERKGGNLTAEEYNTLEFEVRDGVAHVTLNRPEAGNAINLELAQELLRAVMRCDEEPEVRAVVLAGAGRMFCVGGDLRSFTEQGEQLSHHLKEVTTYLHATISRMARMDPPVVAAVHGAAAGAGLSLTCACDLVVATESARFSMAYSKAGLTPDGSSTYYLPRLVGFKRAMELTLTNRELSAQEAVEWGIVTRVVPDDDLSENAAELAKQLAAGATQALGAAKRLLHLGWTETLETQMEHETQTIADIARTADAREGISAFMEKRSPEFTGER